MIEIASYKLNENYNVICNIPSPLAPLTRPSDTSTFVVSITLAPIVIFRTVCRPPVSDLLSDKVESQCG